jgi:hypothetical protein
MASVEKTGLPGPTASEEPFVCNECGHGSPDSDAFQPIHVRVEMKVYAHATADEPRETDLVDEEEYDYWGAFCSLE